MNDFSVFCCPVCKQAWTSDPTLPSGQTLHCTNKHSFDLAKTGYVNLLAANKKHSKQPGDDKEAVTNRLNFLEQGHYNPLIDALETTIASIAQGRAEPFRLLDIGCGPGYYLEQLDNRWESKLVKLSMAGVDISKAAIQMAAKRNGSLPFAVASSAEIPVGNASIEVAMSIFAPCSEEELTRILTTTGTWINVTPGEQHLQELRALLYDTLKPIQKSEPQSTALYPIEPGIDVLFKCNLSQVQLEQLLHMTPYRWTKPEFSSPRSLETSMHFKVQQFGKKATF